MNERIKELAIRVQRTEMPGVLFAHPEFVGKFAELIIKECLHIVDDEGAGEGGCIRAMIRIQDEFGVEQ